MAAVNKTSAIRAVIRETVEQPIIFTTGYSSRIAVSISDRPNHFYMTGSMGLAASIGAGLALASGLSTVVIDGDGSLAMNPGCLLTVGSMPAIPLLHIVLDDGLYESTGGQAVPTDGVNFAALAKSSGYEDAFRVDDLGDFTDLLRKNIEGHLRPTLIHCVLSDRGVMDLPSRVDGDLRRQQLRFSRHVSRVKLCAR
ncbi:thiamine pyrophosphate-dependent enzyme [Streptomyces mirabilis]|uniref:thiamine pyrophosphate-dependent enzyme n=1 Tax=Streptomyces mirabilis TaxID=68239 RepID=UPI00331B8DF1